jgi:1,5-anhydro-D-fructose reductase (1,5-anhydro-D-mannitol-forming)
MTAPAADPVRWAIVGTSEFAVEWIAPAIKASTMATLAAVVSSSSDRARSVASRLEARLGTDDVRKLDPSEVDVVHLVTPNALHEPLTIAAFERGLHVVVEKPMALDVMQARRMVDAAGAAGRLLAVAHCMAWAPPVHTASTLVTDGAIGRPIDIRIAAGFDSPPADAWRQTTPTEAGGGPWLDLGPHAVDAAVRIMGPVASVDCLIDRLVHDYAAEDTVTAMLRFRSGAHGSVTTTFVAGQNELVIQGTGGRLRSGEWLGRDFAGELTFEPPDHGVGRFDVEVARGARDIPLQRTNVYRPQVDDVSGAIRDGTPSRIDGIHGLHVMEVLEAAIASARSGRRVDIPLPVA